MTLKHSEQYISESQPSNSTGVWSKPLLDKILYGLILYHIREQKALNKQQAKGNALARLQSQFAKKPKNPV